MADTYLTIQQAAAIIGVKRSRMYQYIGAGKFPNARRWQHEWMLPEKDVRAFRRPRYYPGKPGK